MKKIISICLVLSYILSAISINAFAVDLVGEEIRVVEDEIIEEVYGLYNTNNNSSVSLMSTGLIVSKSLKLAKTTSSLIITATTIGNTDVTKCGFTYIKLQRLINGTWTDYSSYCYYDQYNEYSSKSFEKSISAPKGYTYRVICSPVSTLAPVVVKPETISKRASIYVG